MNIEKALEYAKRKAAGTITPEENALLAEWIYHSSRKEYEAFTDDCILELRQMEGNRELFRDAPDVQRANLRRLKQQLSIGENKYSQLFTNKAFWVAAALVILCLSGLYFWLNHQTEQPPVQVVDVDPGTLEHPPTIVLPDGTQGAVNVSGIDAQVVKDFITVHTFDPADKRIKRPMVINGVEDPKAFSSISTPAGIRYKVIFEDSSTVLLNALSTLNYAGRKMELDGEANFTIMPAANRPMSVKTRYSEVQVLGTRFNVKSYYEEKADHITLLEGAINVSTTTFNRKPEAGYELIIMPGAAPVYNAVDTSDITSWSAGYFGFKSVPVDQVLNELSHWYGFIIEYKGAIPDIKVTLDATRKSELEGLLILLKATGLKYDLKGKVLKVLN